MDNEEDEYLKTIIDMNPEGLKECVLNLNLII